MSSGSLIFQEMHVAVELQAVASSGMQCPPFDVFRQGGNGVGKIGVDDEFNVGRTVGDSNKGVIFGYEVLDHLFVCFSPEVISRDGVFHLVKSPHPVTGREVFSGHGTPSYSLNNLGGGIEGGTGEAGAGPDGGFLQIVFQGHGCPAGAWIGWGPGGPGTVTEGVF